MKLNRTAILKAVNESLSERGSTVRVRYSSQWQEFQVTYPDPANPHTRTFAPCSSLVDAIESAICETRNQDYYQTQRDFCNDAM